MTDLTPITFNATARTIASLDQLHAAGDTRTDVLNRAVAAYAALVQAANGGGVLEWEDPDGTVRQVWIR